MSAGMRCRCPEREKPVKDRQWFVLVYKWNNSHFVRAGGEHSDYSLVYCAACGFGGRTKAKYVDDLRHATHADFRALEAKLKAEGTKV